MSRTLAPSRPRWRRLVALFSVAALLGAGAAPAQAAEILVYRVTTAEVDIVVTLRDDPDFIFYRVEATNLSTEAVHLGFGADLRQKGTTDFFWLEPSGAFGFSTVGQAVIEPGMTYEELLLPGWSGMTYSFFSDIDTVPTLVGEFVNAGVYLPFDVQSTDGAVTGIQIGYPVTIRPLPARAGESIRIDSAVGSDWPDAEIGVWIREIAEGDTNSEIETLFVRGLIGGAVSTYLTDPMRRLGSVPVSTNAAAGNVTLPADLTPGDYVLLLGDDGVGWPGGPAISFVFDEVQPFTNLVIEDGAPRGSTAPDPLGGPVQVTPLDQFGSTPVTFTFDEVTTGGTTSVATSTSGPASTAFTLLGGVNAVYYELQTTAAFAGAVTVCLSYDPTNVTPAQQNAIALFHYTGGAWSNITTTRAPGQVCGSTTSFSPSTLGIPTLQYTFEGFLAPVSNTKINQEFAGSVVPIRFRLGGNQGLDVIASGSPTTGVTACTVGATPTTSQPARSVVTPTLPYVTATGTYWYLWKTDKSWAGTCRQFSLTLADGSVHTASFKFTKLTFGAVLRSII